ncbi:MAG: hypothetical protein NT145_09070, partial [Elusimicrobia bacterium]|nr:hypothetical protein [Elusimicrobiota bacterium]
SKETGIKATKELLEAINNKYPDKISKKGPVGAGHTQADKDNNARLVLPKHRGLEKELENKISELRNLKLKEPDSPRIKILSKEITKLSREIAKKEAGLSLNHWFVQLHYPKLLQELIDDHIDRYQINKVLRDELKENEKHIYDERVNAAKKIIERTYEWGFGVFAASVFVLFLTMLPVFGAGWFVVSIIGAVILSYLAGREANIRTQIKLSINKPAILDKLINEIPGLFEDRDGFLNALGIEIKSEQDDLNIKKEARQISKDDSGFISAFQIKTKCELDHLSINCATENEAKLILDEFIEKYGARVIGSQKSPEGNTIYKIFFQVPLVVGQYKGKRITVDTIQISEPSNLKKIKKTVIDHIAFRLVTPNQEKQLEPVFNYDYSSQEPFSIGKNGKYAVEKQPSKYPNPESGLAKKIGLVKEIASASDEDGILDSNPEGIYLKNHLISSWNFKFKNTLRPDAIRIELRNSSVFKEMLQEIAIAIQYIEQEHKNISIQGIIDELNNSFADVFGVKFAIDTESKFEQKQHDFDFIIQFNGYSISLKFQWYYYAKVETNPRETVIIPSANTKAGAVPGEKNRTLLTTPSSIIESIQRIGKVISLNEMIAKAKELERINQLKIKDIKKREDVIKYFNNEAIRKEIIKNINKNGISLKEFAHIFVYTAILVSTSFEDVEDPDFPKAHLPENQDEVGILASIIRIAVRNALQLTPLNATKMLLKEAKKWAKFWSRFRYINKIIKKIPEFVSEHYRGNILRLVNIGALRTKGDDMQPALVTIKSIKKTMLDARYSGISENTDTAKQLEKENSIDIEIVNERTEIKKLYADKEIKKLIKLYFGEAGISYDEFVHIFIQAAIKDMPNEPSFEVEDFIKTNLPEKKERITEMVE